MVAADSVRLRPLPLLAQVKCAQIARQTLIFGNLRTLNSR